jgi:transcriptional regulator with XRE-family HTH domain
MQAPREQLAAALKKARLEAGYSTHGALAKHLLMARSTITKAESPTQPIPGEALLIAWADATGTPVEEFTTLIQRAKSGTPDWFMPYKQAEQEATSLRLWGPANVPGLLQTSGYARSQLSVQRHTVEQLDALVDARLQRQEVLGRAMVTAVLDYRALANSIGTAEVMAEQCAHLVALVESARIGLHVVPEGMNVHLGGGFAVATRGSSVTVSVTTATRDIASTAPDMIEETLRAFDLVLGMSLPPVPSIGLVREYEDRWKGKV